MNTKYGQWTKHFPPGYSFTIKDATKRSDGEWHSRWTWELHTNDHDTIDCDWWGFDTMHDAMDNLAEHIEKTYGGIQYD